MQKIYCSQCGSPNLYVQAKPKFCSACGTAFYGVIVEKPQDKKTRENKVRAQEEYDGQDDENDDEESDASIPDLENGLQVEYQAEGPRKESLGKIAATLPDNMVGFGSRGAEGLSVKETLKMFKKEAGTLRQK
jgi:uncharacterized Zn finger protein (UPF0148 family)